jgi:DNA-binding PadR family transcriptional regulator
MHSASRHDGGGRDFLRAVFSHWSAGRDSDGGYGGDYRRASGGHGFGGAGRGGGGRRRLFDGEQLQLLLLALIAEAPRHGYDLIKEIEARSGGVYAPSPGVVYPTLTMLDEIGHVDEVKEAGARRRFAITEAGRAHLAEKQEAAESLLQRLAALDADRARTDRAPLRRAFTNLGMAVRETMAGCEDHEARAHEVAAILDEATQKIERL